MMAFQGDNVMALTFIVIGAVFDFFDGFAARLLHVSSPIGKELDSLADDITFGFAPAAIVYSLLQDLNPCLSFPGTLIPYAGFLIAAFSALRLAKFNLDERQTTSFIGLPTPANALFWAATAIGFHGWLMASPFGFYLILALTFISCGLLVAEIPMFALKFKNFSLKDNRLRYAFLILAVVLIALLWIRGLAATIVLYILLSLLTQRKE
jgi:CDP-diacylglycerol--serine O-phosphatidyltransferase